MSSKKRKIERNADGKRNAFSNTASREKKSFMDDSSPGKLLGFSLAYSPYLTLLWVVPEALGIYLIPKFSHLVNQPSASCQSSGFKTFL